MASGKLIVLTGGRGSGKTTGLATLAPPSELSKMLVVDVENSWADLIRPTALGAKIGCYINAYERFGLGDRMLSRIKAGDLPWVSRNRSSLVDFYEWFVAELDNKLVKGKYKYVVIDTIEPIEAAMTAAVDAGKGKFGWQGSKAYGRLETEGVRPLYENLLQSIYERGVEVVGVASHIKYVWMGDKPVLNKVKPGGRLAVLSRLSSLMLWLVPNHENEDGAPAALVLKARMGNMVADGDGWKVQRVLPRRIPHFTWRDVDQYLKHPANLAKPGPGEAPSKAEIEMISEMLTDEQMRLMVIGAEIERELVKSGGPMLGIVEEPLNEEVIGQITIMQSQGVPIPLIAKRLDVPMNRVREVVAQAQDEEMGMAA